jgi:hypothetical protein
LLVGEGLVAVQQNKNLKRSKMTREHLVTMPDQIERSMCTAQRVVCWMQFKNLDYVVASVDTMAEAVKVWP